ncbi:MAG: hypothetical protein AAGH88_06010 [Planctomycetota bacterium]
MHWLNQLAATRDQRWAIGIGDPSVFGWATVAAYLLAALLCLLAWRHANAAYPGHARLRLFLGSTTLLMLALAINKQLDLQTFITQTGKDLAKVQGWYDQRRAAQRSFVFGVAGAGALAMLLALFLLRGLLGRVGVIMLGLCVTLSFVVVRAASFHHVDHLIGMELVGVRVNVILELGGIMMVCLGALVCMARPATAHHNASPATA